jgi:plastocyanin
MRPLANVIQAALILLCCASSGIAGAAELRVNVIDQNGKPIEDAVAVVEPVAASPANIASASTLATMDQVDKQFTPFVLAIQAGTQVAFPNHDNTRHHVYSFSPAKQFQLPLYAGDAVPPIVFDKPGIVVIGCNIHDWMLSYIYVTDTPFFGKTGKSGEAAITQLPAGTYTVRIWHPALRGPEADTQRVVAVTGDEQKALQWQLALSSPSVQRRAPLPHSQAY